MRVCLMIEGQEDVTWDQWVALAGACETHGLEGLFRSDHYTSVGGHLERGSLDAWTTLAALGAVTERLTLGTLVSPVTFRHPSLLAKAVVTADHVSGGRVELGLGAGWHVDEHERYGFAFPDVGERLDRLAEQLEIVVRQWTEDEFDFDGAFYRLEGCRGRPAPVQDPRPNVIVGGMAGPRSAALAARWADEYNTVFASPETCAQRRETVVRAWEDAGRDPATATFSLMTGAVVGRDHDEVRERGRRLMARNAEEGDVDAYLDGLRRQWVIGTVDECRDRLATYEDAGVERVMMQHLVHDDLDMVALLGELHGGAR